MAAGRRGFSAAELASNGRQSYGRRAHRHSWRLRVALPPGPQSASLNSITRRSVSTSNGRVGSLPTANDGRFRTSSRSRRCGSATAIAAAWITSLIRPTCRRTKRDAWRSSTLAPASQRGCARSAPRRSSERELEIRDRSGQRRRSRNRPSSASADSRSSDEGTEQVCAGWTTDAVAVRRHLARASARVAHAAQRLPASRRTPAMSAIFSLPSRMPLERSRPQVSNVLASRSSAHGCSARS